ncbi:MAG TPA: glycosyltransferase family 4 protein [Beijerinckiaceae bacterium]|nr:glycosyltransferase family 4 protein [Beijerinckiaceae bacterium]HVB89045.1 glycosyltransferase family 4 protein [Beijerinckiaceae bacterium]
MSSPDARSLKILHVLRAPLGGLFRHVLDLAREQAARGHRIGLVTDSLTGGAWAESILAELAPVLALGLSRTPMRRNPHPGDLAALAHVIGRIRSTEPDIVHGHGSKGGAFARLPAFLPGAHPAKCAYTPHGGSFNYRQGTVWHTAYMTAERLLARRTDAFLFESAYIQGCFHRHVSAQCALERIVLNGISEGEFIAVAPAPDAADFVYVGELRSAKGIDTMLEALALVGTRMGRPPRSILVGSGPDQEQLASQANRLGLTEFVSFPGQLPARQAFSLGRIMVVPSRAESLPYVVLEAAGARMPLIATNVGGIPEIFGPYAHRLIPCDDVERLAAAMQDFLSAPGEKRLAQAEELAQFVASRFTIANMVDAVMAGYADALAHPFKKQQVETGPLTISS